MVNSGDVASLILRLSRWKFVGEVPALKKYVCIAYPHTSNWDGLAMIVAATSLKLNARWMIKDSWTKSPVGPLLLRLGAMPVDRSKSNSVVSQMVEEFRRRDEFVLGIPPEGTRSRAEHWRSGFYHIAVGAKVPVVPGYIDFARRQVGLGPALEMTGDVRADMDRVRAYYRSLDLTAYEPANVGPIRLREEG